MKVRYSINDAGEFVDRDGNSIGRVTSLTLELDSSRGKGVEALDVPPSPTGKEGNDPNTENQPPTPAIDALFPVASELDTVWAHYVRTFDSKAELNAQRRRDIERALKVRDVKACCEAIDGLAKSPHHNGANETGTKYLDIRYALRGNSARGESHEERIDRMRQLAYAKPGSSLPSRSSGLGNANPWAGRIADLKRDVMRAWHPDPNRPPASPDELARADAAATALEGHGITVRYVDGKPTFEVKS